MTERPGSIVSWCRANASRSLARGSGRRSRRRWSNANGRSQAWVTSTISATAAFAHRGIEAADIERAGKTLAAERGLPWRPTVPGTHITGQLVGPTQLSSGRFAMLETLSGDGGLGFSLVPWQPVLDNRIGQHISGLIRPGGDIEWSFGRKRGLGLWAEEPCLLGPRTPGVPRQRFAACGLDRMSAGAARACQAGKAQAEAERFRSGGGRRLSCQHQSASLNICISPTNKGWPFPRGIGRSRWSESQLHRHD